VDEGDGDLEVRDVGFLGDKVLDEGDGDLKVRDVGFFGGKVLDEAEPDLGLSVEEVDERAVELPFFDVPREDACPVDVFRIGIIQYIYFLFKLRIECL